MDKQSLDIRLLNTIREDSKKVEGIDRLRACHLLMDEYGLSLAQANNYTKIIGDIIRKEKEDKNK